MKKLLLIACLAMISIGSFAKSSDYRIDDAQVESVLNEGTTYTPASLDLDLTDPSMELRNELYADKIAADKDPLVAILLDVFVGGLAIHRVYLGGNPILILGYLVTCGGIFGILPIGDLIVLAINYDDISPYVNNSKFIMW